jgi:hypothetical protein
MSKYDINPMSIEAARKNLFTCSLKFSSALEGELAGFCGG